MKVARASSPRAHHTARTSSRPPGCARCSRRSRRWHEYLPLAPTRSSACAAAGCPRRARGPRKT
eukprot:scaffold169859_cov33-Tisochrysis_lutea.AAC.3